MPLGFHLPLKVWARRLWVSTFLSRSGLDASGFPPSSQGPGWTLLGFHLPLKVRAGRFWVSTFLSRSGLDASGFPPSSQGLGLTPLGFHLPLKVRAGRLRFYKEEKKSDGLEKRSSGSGAEVRAQ